ncbi:MAG: ATP-binding cassette domain-containing protein [Synergistaceae bacterium]|jgi:oligopeptide/dipeptide ABC transporter ATP-binding protein|nr:ATP-binding cassette domain-containing protein [Synergistaceae bacterium]
MADLMTIDELSVHYERRRMGGCGRKVRAVDGVSLSIRRGEILSVVGESGCGKTTMGKAILNITRATSGRIIYDGIDLAKISGAELRAMRRKFQMIYQDPYESLDPRQSIYDTLLEPLLIHRRDLSSVQKRDLVMSHLEAVGLRPAEMIAARYPHHLSGGQRQRVAIAAAIILEPDFIVADEPVSMLDVSVRSEILKLMLDLQKDKDLTYMFITHDLSLAWMISHRIAVFYLGRMVEIGGTEEVVHRSTHPYTNALVSVIPTVGKKMRGERHILAGETPSASEIPGGCRFHTRCWLYHDEGEPEICRNSEPELAEVADGHMAACHFKLIPSRDQQAVFDVAERLSKPAPTLNPLGL